MKTLFQFTLPVVLILCAGAIARADAQPPTVAIYDFAATGQTARDFGPKVTALVTANLSAETNLVMVERAELTRALSEQAFGLSGMINSDAATKIGRMTGAKVLVAGQVFPTDDGHLTIVASIIGTETSRLYAAKVEGSAGNLTALTSDLARKISKTIAEQYTNLMVVTEPHERRIERIIKAVRGKNRPAVLMDVSDRLPGGKTSPNSGVTTELGLLLQKAGFTVVDKKSDTKPDVEIIGVASCDWGPKHGELFSCRAVVEIKVQERRTGDILAFDRQESEAVDIGKHAAAQAALLNATDGLAERLLPLLAK